MYHAKRFAKVCEEVMAWIVPALLALTILTLPSAYLIGSDVAEPPVRVPSNVAWTAQTIERASSGMRFAAC